MSQKQKIFENLEKAPALPAIAPKRNAGSAKSSSRSGQPTSLQTRAFSAETASVTQTQNTPIQGKRDPAAHANYNFTRTPLYPTSPNSIQREAAPEEELQRRTASPSLLDAKPDVPVASGGGNTLSPTVQRKMEAAFGQSFADVRIHEGPEAKAVGALAYTRGADIHFQPGQYNPNTPSGQELLGHELTHVVQQRSGRVPSPQGKGAPINADPALEAEADTMGAKAMRAEEVEVSGAGSGVQRKEDSIQAKEPAESATANPAQNSDSPHFTQSQWDASVVDPLGHTVSALEGETPALIPAGEHLYQAYQGVSLAASQSGGVGDLRAHLTQSMQDLSSHTMPDGKSLASVRADMLDGGELFKRMWQVDNKLQKEHPSVASLKGAGGGAHSESLDKISLLTREQKEVAGQWRADVVRPLTEAAKALEGETPQLDVALNLLQFASESMQRIAQTAQEKGDPLQILGLISMCVDELEPDYSSVQIHESREQKPINQVKEDVQGLFGMARGLTPQFPA